MMKNRFKFLLLFVLMTIIVVYISVPLYGVIRDWASEVEGEVVFILDSPLPEIGSAGSKNGIFDRIHQILFPPKEVSVPIERRIDIRGSIVYTDRTPYVNGLIELRSEPRYTHTDNDGYFVFTGVEVGPHIISVLDEKGNVLASSSINIERVTENSSVELVRLPDNTLVFRISLNLELLELTITLKKDAANHRVMLEKVDLGIADSGAAPGKPTETPKEPGKSTEAPGEPGKPPEAPKEPGTPTEPPKEPGRPPEKPKDPTKPSDPSTDPKTPDKPPLNPDPPSPQPPISDRFKFDVLDSADRVHFGSGSAVNVYIFGTKKRIAPGMKGSNSFIVDNRNNDYSARYEITFIPVDTLPVVHKIPMLYRLKKDGVYVAGDQDTWRTATEMRQDAVLEKGKSAKYTLDWYWPEGDQDNKYAKFGGDPNYSYSLTIKVTASSQ